MTQSDNKRPKFTIRRIDQPDTSPAPSSTPPPRPAADPPPVPPTPPRNKSKRPSGSKPSAPPVPPTPSRNKSKRPSGSKRPVPPPPPRPSVTLEAPQRDRTGATFRSASKVLAFLGSAFSAGMVNEAVVRRSPHQGWWVELEVDYDRTCALIWTAGGRPFAAVGSQWVALSVSGELPAEQETPLILEVNDWAIVELATLLAETHLLSGRYRGAAILDVVVPGLLGRWVLRRSAALGLKVQICPVQRYALGQPGGQPSSALRLRLQAPPNRVIPAALVHSLTHLPYVIVAEPLALEGRDLLVDVRHRLPLPSLLVQQMIPAGETWVLGPPDVGYWCLQADGDEIEGALLLEAPPMEMIPLPPQTDCRAIAPIPVQLVSRPGLRRPVDAVLLDDRELAWLRSWLMGRPMGETAFVLPGQGRHLLTAPGGLAGAVPFGDPLSWMGPGSLYVALGTTFYPPLPDAARQTRFELGGDRVVVVLPDTAYRFDLAQMLPAWSLWVGDAPEVKGGLSPRGKQLLASLSAAIRQAEAQPMPLPPQIQMRPVTRSERVRLLERAQRLELRGEWVQAAELLEKAGYPGPAGRLYERAAKG